MRAIVKAIKDDPRGVRLVASRAGVSKYTIYHWLSGYTKSPGIKTMTRVAEALGFSINMKAESVKLIPFQPVHRTPPPAALSGPRLRMLLRSLQ